MKFKMLVFKVLKFFGYNGKCPLCKEWTGGGKLDLVWTEYLYGETGGGTINGPHEGKVGEMWVCRHCFTEYTNDNKGFHLL